MPVLVNPSRFTPPVTGGGNWAAAMAALTPSGWYRLNETSGTTMADSSGNGHNGTYGASVTLNVAGATSDSDKGVTTSGTSAGTGTVPNAVWMDVSDTVVTMAAFVKWTGSPGTSMFWSRTGGSAFGCGLWVSGGKINWNVRTGISSGIATPLSTYNDGNWHLAVGTYDGANMILYVDGAQVATGAKTGSMSQSLQDLQVGGRGTSYFAGGVDEAAVWIGTALTSTQIATLYAAR